MKIGTSNKLAHYQVELNELCEKKIMLQNRLQPLNNEIITLRNYLAYNQGDRQSVTNLRKKMREYNSICTQINKMTQRIAMCQNHIQMEMRRACVNLSKPVGNGYGYGSRGGIGSRGGVYPYGYNSRRYY